MELQTRIQRRVQMMAEIYMQEHGQVVHQDMAQGENMVTVIISYLDRDKGLRKSPSSENK